MKIFVEKAVIEQALDMMEFVKKYPRATTNNSALSETITALRDALAEQMETTVSDGVCGGCAKKAADGWALYCIECWEKAEQDLDTCPGCGGVADNGHDREFPPNPYYCTKCTEQAEQEPVGWYKPSDFVLYRTKPDDVFVYVPLYAAPVRTKELTPEEIKLPVDVVIGCGTIKAGCSLRTLLKKIEVINETWIPKMQSALQHKRGCAYERIDQDPSECTCGVTEARELFAAPVRTKDLTDEEIDKIAAESTGLLYLDFARAVIAADREKNK